MQNKGFVRSIAVALMLICLFYLSFSFVTGHYSNKAKEFAQGDQNAYYQYMDSIQGEEVWLWSYTLKECRENEINLGLDLKGGMNVMLEVSVSDIIDALADHSQDKDFRAALKAARTRQLSSGSNFLSLFEEEYEKIAPGASLSSIFSTYELKDKIQLGSTNKEVLAVLKEEIDNAIDNSFNVLRSRIDRFGVVQPNISKVSDVQGRILVELPGIKEPERVRKLLQGSANLEFWETYDASEIMPQIVKANKALGDLVRVAEKEAAQDSINAVVNDDVNSETIAKTEPAADAVVSDSTVLNDTVDDLLGEEATDVDQAAERAKYRKNNPLFAVLQPFQGNKGPVIGYTLSRDTAKVNELLATKVVRDLLPRQLSLKWTVKAIDPDVKQPVFELIAIKVSNRDGRAPLEGDVITDANADFGQYSSSANVNMKMNAEGAKAWARLTKENVGKSIAIVLDGYVYSFPTVNGEITGGSSEISGNFTSTEAKDLANVLKSGKMPAPAHIVQEDVVGPSLGAEAIHDGLISFIIAFVIVLLYMIFYYGLIPGLIADGALILNVVFIFGILASFKAVLTLPGIAGIVLTLGTAVDANVLIYERIREELRGGKNIKKAISDGYSNALSAIIDANVTTLMTGVILVYFGTGPIKGFATTFIIGIITSVFTAVFLTRLVYDRIVKSEKNYDLQFTTKTTRNWFQNTKIDFVAKRKIGYVISGTLIVLSVLSLSFHGLSKGIDFSGGRNYVVRFDTEKVDAEELRSTLDKVFPDAQTSVITMGEANQVRISTNYEIANVDQDMDAKIENMLYLGLDKFIDCDAVTPHMFSVGYVKDGDSYRDMKDSDVTDFGIQSSQKVGPTIADDIKTAAIWAIFFSLIAIFLYILLRFTHYTYSVGAVVALAHDAFIILGVYSIFYSIMPFSLEIDQAFIAAILTVIGYSINDTVVIFDRIREFRKIYPKHDLKTQINDSLNSTLSRTFSTSMSTAVVLLAIFLFGGETIRGFVFALLLGVIVGTYSSLFIASPIAYDMTKNKVGIEDKSKKSRKK